MASSSSSAIRTLLEEFVGGRLSADRLVTPIAERFYRAGVRGAEREREALVPLMEVIERAAPGIVQLARIPDGPGFDIRLAERSFPAEFEPDLRRAAAAVLAGGAFGTGADREAAAPGFWARLMGRVRRLFSATT